MDSKTPWAALKAEATRQNIRLITVLEREAKASTAGGSKEEDPLVVNDPWKRTSASKKVQKDRKQATLRIDDSIGFQWVEIAPTWGEFEKEISISDGYPQQSTNVSSV